MAHTRRTSRRWLILLGAILLLFVIAVVWVMVARNGATSGTVQMVTQEDAPQENAPPENAPPENAPENASGSAGDGASASNDQGWFTEEQASRGEEVYAQECAQCHGEELQGGVGPALTGQTFWDHWGGDSVYTFFEYIQRMMPQNAPGSLETDTYTDVTAYLLQTNGFPAGSEELPATEDRLSELTIDQSLTTDGDTSGQASADGGAAGDATPAASEGDAAAASEGDAAADASQGDTTQGAGAGDTTQDASQGDTTQDASESDTTPPASDGDTAQASTEGSADAPPSETSAAAGETDAAATPESGSATEDAAATPAEDQGGDAAEASATQGADDGASSAFEGGWFARSQVQAGEIAFTENCARCHGNDLQGNPPLVGGNFPERYHTVWQLYQYVQQAMPLDRPGSLRDQTYLDAIAYVLDQNGYPVGEDRREPLRPVLVEMDLTAQADTPEPSAEGGATEGQTDSGDAASTQTDNAQTDNAQTDNAQPDNAQANDAQTDNAQTDNAQGDGAQGDGGEANDAQNGGAQTETASDSGANDGGPSANGGSDAAAAEDGASSNEQQTNDEGSSSEGYYPQEQADRGQDAYAQNCAQCHGDDLQGLQGQPALTGDTFLSHHETVWDLFDYARQNMPLTDPGSLEDETYADIVAHILAVNDFPAGGEPLGPDQQQQMQNLPLDPQAAQDTQAQNEGDAAQAEGDGQTQAPGDGADAQTQAQGDGAQADGDAQSQAQGDAAQAEGAAPAHDDGAGAARQADDGASDEASPLPELAALEIEVRPANVTLNILGPDQLARRAVGAQTLEDLQPGTYVIAAARGHESVTTNINLAAGETGRVDLVLDELSRSSDVPEEPAIPLTEIPAIPKDPDEEALIGRVPPAPIALAQGYEITAAGATPNTEFAAGRGQQAFALHCSRCHGADLQGNVAPALTGDVFFERWGGHPVDWLYFQARAAMPPHAAGFLDEQTYADIITYILTEADVLEGFESFSPGDEAFRTLVIEPARTGDPGQALDRQVDRLRETLHGPQDDGVELAGPVTPVEHPEDPGIAPIGYRGRIDSAAVIEAGDLSEPGPDVAQDDVAQDDAAPDTEAADGASDDGDGAAPGGQAAGDDGQDPAAADTRDGRTQHRPSGERRRPGSSTRP